VFLLVLRLLAVYFATCAVALILVKRYVFPVRKRVAFLLSIAPFLLVGKAMFTAGVYAPLDIVYQAHPLAARRAEAGIGRTVTPILGDVVFQEVPWRKAVREAAKNGRLPLWNRFQLAGEPLLAVQQPAVLHPGTWIGFLLPLAQAWTFEMALRHFLALLAMYLFLRELRLGEVPALLGAVGWCFADYLVFFAGYPLTPAVAPFPLLLLGLGRLVSEPGARAIGITAAALLLNLTSGHPETLLHAVAAAGVYFLFELAWAGRRRRARPLSLALVAGGVTLGLSAVLLLPLAEALPHTAEHALRSSWYAHVDKSVSVAESLRRSIPNVVPYGHGVSGAGKTAIGFGEPAGYAGAVLLPFAAVGLFSRRREKWPILLLGLLGLALWARFPGVTDAVASLPLFDIGLNERLVFLAAFAVSALAALGAERVREGEGLGALAASAAASVAAIATLFVEVRPTLLKLEVGDSYLRDRLLVQLVPLALIGLGAAFLLFSPAGRRVRRAAGLAAAALLLLLVQRGLEAGSVYATFPNRAFYPPLEVLDPIPRDAPWRFTAAGFLFIPNISALYELEDVRGYEAMTFKPLTETFPLWSVPQAIWFNRVDDPELPFLSFLNVRWILIPEEWRAPPDWKTLAEGDGTKLVENPRALPRAFAPRLLRAEETDAAAIATLHSITDFAGHGVVDSGDVPWNPGEWRANGGASVTIDSYRTQRLEFSVDAESSAIVGTSIPRWPGWKLEIDGKSAPLLGYNRAFLGFEVPAGRRRVVLSYLPDGFLWGAGISGGTLLGCVLTSWALRRRPARASSSAPPAPAGP
jgi:hypothetical protein